MKNKLRGVALVEFALLLPVLLVMTFIVTEFGRAIYQYNTLTKSVRDAARYLSIQTPGTRIAEAKNLVVYGNTAGTGRSLALGLTTVHVQDPVWETAGTAPVISTVTVEIRDYEFPSMFTTTVFGLPFDSFFFSPIRATMRSHL